MCERCFFDSDFGVNEDGTYRRPTQLRDMPAEACCFCGGLTVAGIYVRKDQEQILCKGRHDDLSWSRVGTRVEG